MTAQMRSLVTMAPKLPVSPVTTPLERRTKLRSTTSRLRESPSLLSSSGGRLAGMTETLSPSGIKYNFGNVKVNTNARSASFEDEKNDKSVGISEASPRNSSTAGAGAGVPAPTGGTGAGSAHAPAAPGRTPAPQASPGPHPLANFSPVEFDARARRIPPTRTVNVAVAITGLAAGRSAAIDVEGSGGANGTATITAGASLAGSGTVTVRGGTQTTPGSAGGLKLRAKVGGVIIGTSSGFTVAAWPIDYTDTRVSDIDIGGAVGVKVQDGWSSDGSGPVSELTQVKISERVDIQSRDNPPFTNAGGTSASVGTSGYLDGHSLTTDSHAYPRADIKTTGLASKPWMVIYGQLCIFKCLRTGVTDLVMPKSGYKIVHIVIKFPIFGWTHLTRKMGQGVTVEGRTATAGAGDASSDLHYL